MLVVITVAFVLYVSNGQLANLPFVPQGPVIKQLQIGVGKLKVEIADTQAKRSKGLSDRQSLASDEGMLFVFPQPSKYSFWMKSVKFPLDFIWIRGSTVVDLLPNVSSPAPGQTDESLPIYQPNTEVDKALEVPSGTIQRLNIKIGDSIKIE